MEPSISSFLTSRLARPLIGACLALAACAASAGGNLYWNVGVQVPGAVVGVANTAPVYVAPQPVYVAPPPQVVYAPPPVRVMPPARIGWAPPPHFHRHHHHGHGGWRERRGWDGDGEGRWR